MAYAGFNFGTDPLNDIAYDLLTRKFYNTYRKLVNYGDYLKAVDMNYTRKEAAPVAASTIQPLAGKAKKTFRSVDSIVQDLKELFVARRTDFKGFFEDYDPLRHGLIVRSKFGAALKLALGSSLNYMLGTEELEAICDRYGAADGRHVLWKNLIADIKMDDGVALESCPTKALPTLKFPVFSEYDSGVDANALDLLLSRLNHKVIERRNNVKPSFQPFDRKRKSEVSKKQFFSVLKTLGLLPATGEERDLLVKAFQTDTGGIHYIRFCQRVEPQAQASTAF